MGSAHGTQRVIVMIAKAEWFMPRKFGWGLGIRTWQGAAYIIGIIVLLVILSFLPVDGGLRLTVTLLWGALVAYDLLLVLPKVYAGLDEREQKHQLIAERNASFVGVIFGAVMVVSFAFTLAQNGVVDWNARFAQLWPMIALLVLMAIAKGGSLLWLEREG